MAHRYAVGTGIPGTRDLHLPGGPGRTSHTAAHTHMLLGAALCTYMEGSARGAGVTAFALLRSLADFVVGCLLCALEGL